MKIIGVILVVFILLLVFGLCKVASDYDDAMERQYNEENKYTVRNEQEA